MIQNKDEVSGHPSEIIVKTPAKPGKKTTNVKKNS